MGRLSAATPEQYQQQLNALLPDGDLWVLLRKDPALQSLLLACADSLARLHNRIFSLRNEADPRYTLEMLPEWEAAVGLPDDCVQRPLSTIERRNAVVARIVAVGRADAAYFVQVAAQFGYTVTVEDSGDHEWTVHAEEGATVTEFIAGESVAGDSLGEYGNEQLECLINRIKPAHTQVIFTYGED